MAHEVILEHRVGDITMEYKADLGLVPWTGPRIGFSRRGPSRVPDWTATICEVSLEFDIRSGNGVFRCPVMVVSDYQDVGAVTAEDFEALGWKVAQEGK